MSLKITPEIFKWLQSMSLVKEAKRNNEFLQLSEDISLKFYDGKKFAAILKNAYSQSLDDQLIKKLQTLKQNSNPAIRLYNWNILGEVFKKLKLVTIEAAQKSKILNLQSEPVLKILKILFQSRSKPSQPQKKGLKVQISQIGKKPLLQSSNAMQFLIISLSKNFKLSPQHTVNLFLDNNKYLSHLLVKGVKNNFQPILQFLNQIKNNLDFLISHIFCIDEQENIQFFFNGLKSCLISKDESVIKECIQVWNQIAVEYKLKGLNSNYLKLWIKNQGINTLFFTLNKQPYYFQPIIELCYNTLSSQMFQLFQMTEKNLIWSNDKQKLIFFRRLVCVQERKIVQDFTKSQFMQEWLKYLIKASKRVKQMDEIYDMNIIFQSLWHMMGESFQDEKLNLVGSYIQFFKQSLSSKYTITFFSISMSLFNLIKTLGIKKNPYAPQLFKIAITAFSNILSSDQQKVIFLSENLIHSLKEIKNLPGGGLVSVIIKHLSQRVNPSLLQLSRTILKEKRVTQEQSVQILQILTKIVFQDVIYSGLAMDIVFQHILGSSDEIADQYLMSNSKLCLSSFVSNAKSITKTVKELKGQVQEESKTYPEGQNLKFKNNLVLQMQKLLNISCSIQFLQKYLEVKDINLKNSLQVVLFMTYVKVKVEMKKKKVADYLLPLMKIYYDNEDQLQEQIQQFTKEHYPPQQDKEYLSKVTLLKIINRRSLSLSQEVTSMQFKTIDPSILKPSEFALKDLESLKQKRQHLKTIEIQKEKTNLESEQKLKQIKSSMNQKRLIEYGSNAKIDFQYKNLYEFDSIKEQEIVSGIPVIKLVDFEKQQEITNQDDLKGVMKKYRKVWRFLFFKYSTFGAKKQEFKTEEKISAAQIWKMIKQYELFPSLKKQESQMIIKLINDNMKRKNDPQTLTYPGFEDFIMQLCSYGYKKYKYPHIPVGRQVILMIQQLKRVTKQKGGSIELFDSPEDVYFQETDVVREYNRRLKQNPDYILPEGYKKYKLQQISYEYSLHPMLMTNVKNSYTDVYEVLHQILFKNLGISLIQPLSIKSQTTLAKPVLFQNITQKMKEYKRGYLQPKVTIDIKEEKPKSLRKSIVMKKEFKPHINFSLGIKLGLSSVSVKNKTVAQEVAYWMHDMLNAIQNQSLKVQNAGKKRVENTIIRRRRVQSLQKLRKDKSQKKEWKKRAQSVKLRLQMQKKLKNEEETKKKEREIQQKRKSRARQEQQLKQKLSRFEEMKKIMSERNQQKKYKQIQEKDKKKQQIQKYRQKVAEYFQKKREEILQKQQQLKKQKQERQKQQQEKKQQQQKFMKQLYINNLRKQQSLLEKVEEIRQQYEDLWESQKIKKTFKNCQKQLGYLFNLLLKYEKSRISATEFDEIGLGTLNWFMLRFDIVPLLVDKQQVVRMFKFINKEKERRIQREQDEKEDGQQLKKERMKNKLVRGVRKLGLDFTDFQQALFIVAIKGKKILNEVIKKRNKRMERLREMIRQQQDQKQQEQGQQAENKRNKLTVDIRNLLQRVNYGQGEDGEEEDENSKHKADEEEQRQGQQGDEQLRRSISNNSSGLVNEYLYSVQQVSHRILKEVLRYLRLPKDKLGVEQRFREVVENRVNVIKTSTKGAPLKLIKAQMLKQMLKIRLEQVDENQQQQEKDQEQQDGEQQQQQDQEQDK